MSGVYIVGEYIQLSGTFTRTTDDVPADPDDLVVTLVLPDGTTDEATSGLLSDPVDEPGDWEAEFQATMPGIWQVRVDGTGTLDAHAQRAYYVQPSVVPESGS